MTTAKCFNCGKELGIGKSMEELLDDILPVFCSLQCSTQFPNRYTNEFDSRIEDLKIIQKMNMRKKRQGGI